MKELTVFSVLGIVGGFVSSLFGGWNSALTTLVILMGIDYVTGMIVAGIFKSSKKTDTGALESRAGWKGLCRKGVTLFIVLIACRLDVELGSNFVRDAVVIAFMANETISIIENAGQYNSFCDTDLMDRTSDLLNIFSASGTQNDKDVSGIGKIKELFSCVRDLLFVGFKKFNPVETVQEVGEILDDYHEEGTDEDKRGILDLFTKLTEELMNEGFLGDLMTQLSETAEKQKVAKIPQDRKKKEK